MLFGLSLPASIVSRLCDTAKYSRLNYLNWSVCCFCLDNSSRVDVCN